MFLETFTRLVKPKSQKTQRNFSVITFWQSYSIAKIIQSERNENNIDSKSSKDFLEFSVFWEISKVISVLGNYRAEIQETLDCQVSKIQCSKRDS